VQTADGLRFLFYTPQMPSTTLSPPCRLEKDKVKPKHSLSSMFLAPRPLLRRSIICPNVCSPTSVQRPSPSLSCQTFSAFASEFLLTPISTLLSSLGSIRYRPFYSIHLLHRSLSILQGDSYLPLFPLHSSGISLIHNAAYFPPVNLGHLYGQQQNV